VRRVPSSRALTNPLIRQEIAARVAATMAPVQPLLPGVEQGPDIADVVARVAKWYGERTIDIPRIVVVPTGEVTTGYHDFDLQGLNVGYQPVAQEILIQHLRDGERHLLAAASTAVDEARLEDYLVRNLIDFDDIDYESQADLLYKLAGQMVRHLYAKLHEEESVRNVLLFYERPLAQLIHRQMHAHRWERATGYQAQVSKGFEALQPVLFASLEGTPVYDFRRLVARRQDIPNLVFGGFSRCLYPVQKFSSDPEREFAVLLEREAEDLQIKWFKPARGQFKIFYSNEEAYEPDFVVETATHKYLCEPKRADQMTSAEVLAKGRAAVQWCRHASEHELAHGGKAWSYLLIPHDAIDVSATLKSLVARYTYTVAESAALQPLVSGSR
jgi:type III restriction enzyme